MKLMYGAARRELFEISKLFSTVTTKNDIPLHTDMILVHTC